MLSYYFKKNNIILLGGINDKENKKVKVENIIAFLFIIIFLITLTISTIDIIKWKLDSDKTDKQIKEIQDSIEIEEVIEEDITEEIEIINK